MNNLARTPLFVSFPLITYWILLSSDSRRPKEVENVSESTMLHNFRLLQSELTIPVIVSKIPVNITFLMLTDNI